MSERPPGLDDLLDHLVARMDDPIEVAQEWVRALDENDTPATTMSLSSLLSRLLDRIDRYEKNKPSWLHGTPEDVDAWIRDLIPDDKRLAFYQWIGAMAVTEALAAVYENLRNDPREAHGQHYHRDDVEDMLDMVKPEEGGPFPSVLPIGRVFCDIDFHTHTHGGGRLPTCRLDSPE